MVLIDMVSFQACYLDTVLNLLTRTSNKVLEKGG